LLRSLVVLSFLLSPLRGRPPWRGRTATDVACTDCGLFARPPRSGVSPLSRRTWAAKIGPDDGEEGRTRPARRSAAAAACQGIFPGPPAWRPDLGSQTRVPAVTGTDNQNTYADRGGQSGPVSGLSDDSWYPIQGEADGRFSLSAGRSSG